MKVAILVAAICLLIFVLVNVNTVIATINGGTSILEGIDAQDLSGKKLTPYALPASHCKASFPGTPRIPTLSQQLLGGFLSGRSAVMADAKQLYYLGEYRLPGMELGLSDSPAFKGTVIGVTPVQFNSLGVNGLTSSPGNNSIATSSNFNSEPLKIQQALDTFTKGWLRDNGAAAAVNVPLALKGGLYSGREIGGTLKEPNHAFRLRCYCNYPRKSIVVIAARGDAQRVNSRDTQTFLDSLDMWQ